MSDVEHRQGCPALPGYGHAPEPCTCGAMTAETDLLPLPEPGRVQSEAEFVYAYDREDVEAYARATVAHATAAQAAEIERLRAEVERLKGLVRSVGYETLTRAEQAEARAEQLTETLRELVDLKDNVKHSFPNDYAVRKPLAWDKARALLREQEIR